MPCTTDPSCIASLLGGIVVSFSGLPDKLGFKRESEAKICSPCGDLICFPSLPDKPDGEEGSEFVANTAVSSCTVWLSIGVVASSRLLDELNGKQGSGIMANTAELSRIVGVR